LMGFLSLGSLSLILSDHLVSGFSTAVAFHVATSQMNHIFGLRIPNQRSGPLKLIKVCFRLYLLFLNSIFLRSLLSTISNFFSFNFKEKIKLINKLILLIPYIIYLRHGSLYGINYTQRI
jgi:MFS superfamily sulfate permease-like transporter